MKWLNVFMILVAVGSSPEMSFGQLPAQTNTPIRLALVSETDETSTAADVLTAELNSHKDLQLLERNEIEKAYREQGLSAGNKDYLKLGQILGADGLLLMETAKEGTNQYLNLRLVAVKPGVVLVAEKFSWPMASLTEWSATFAQHLDLFLPKLTVPLKDALPISVVNLRSAINSAEGAQTERQLKLLTIQRLSREPQIFVLERQRMELLSEEKGLKLDDSAFWNGSYLLEGVVDQNGYSQDTISLNARLTPPKGGTTLSFFVSGSRTNFAEVINQLVAKVNEALKVSFTVKEWNAAEEAAQFFAEAKWALRWGSYAEAQAAAESAWALGRRDADSAMLRVRTYMVSPDAGKAVIFYPPKERPDAQNIVSALRALDIYNESSRNLPPEEPKVDSDWYRLGLENLMVASRVLQVFNWSPNYYEPVAEKLAELRTAARSTAAWICQSPSVHDSYFIGERVANHDELHHFEEQSSIFSLKLDCGCLWQDTPEDTIALYRELMSSPVFCYLHDQFWFRDSYHKTSLRMVPPRLVAWNKTAQQQIPIVWGNFIQELKASTNVLWQLEAKALQLADATNEMVMAESFTNLFDSIFENRSALISNNVEVLYLEWRTGDLVDRMGGGFASATKDALAHIYYTEYLRRLDEMDRAYRDHADKLVRGSQFLPTFEKQKEYLRQNTPFDFMEFVGLFQEKNYSPAQALEIQPLIVAYKSNLVAQSQTASVMEKGNLMGAISQVGFLENDVNRILNPPAPTPRPKAQPPVTKPEVVAKLAPVATNAPETVTNIITVSKFMKVPLEGLYVLEGDEHLERSSATITAHHWLEGKLVLDFQYGIVIVLRDGKGGYLNVRNESGPAIGMLDPATEHWEIIRCPEVKFEAKSRLYHRSTLWRGELFNCDGGQIKKYHSASHQWEVLPVSDGGNYELFSVNDHLYAANEHMIFEIMADGKSTHILASTRRQPPVSALDTEDWGTPVLVEGPGHSLRVCTKSKVFTWTGGDWNEEGAAPKNTARPDIFTDGVLFRQEGFVAAGYQNGVMVRRGDGTYGNLGDQDDISVLATDDKTAKLCLAGSHAQRGVARPGEPVVQGPTTFWKMPANLLPRLPAALRQADLSILEGDFAAHTLVNERREILQETVPALENYNAALLYFSHDFPLPQIVYLNFDAAGEKTFAWMLFSTNLLFIGAGDANRMPGIRSDQVTGFWVVPLSQLDSAIASAKQIQLAKIAQDEAQANAAAEQARREKERAQKDFLEKYDRNHNGIIDPDEREAALDDPAFIKSELDMIDANHNGWLDAEELVWFDANQNKILEPKEQAGIEIAQHLLAERLLKKYDANGDGFLDRSEFNALMQSCLGTNARSMPGLSLQFPDENHDGHVDPAELETFLKQQTRRGLRSRGMPGPDSFNQLRMDSSQPVDARQMFKLAVETYWQNPSVVNHPTFNRPFPPGAGNVTNGSQPKAEP